MKVRTICIFAFSCITFGSFAAQSLEVRAESKHIFPGKGDQGAWARACGSYDVAEDNRLAGKNLESIDDYKTAIKVYREDPLFFLGCGKALFNLGRFVEAESYFRDALKLNANNSDAFLGLAQTLENLQRNPEAETSYKQSFKLAPNNYDVCMKFGKFEFAQKNFKQSSELFNSAIHLARNDAERRDAKQYCDQMSDEKTPLPKTTVRLFRIKMQPVPDGTQKICGLDGLFAYSGPAGRTMIQPGAHQVHELLLFDKVGKRLFISPVEAQTLMRSGGLRGLKAKGWAGEVRQIGILDMNPDGSTGSKFLIPPPF